MTGYVISWFFPPINSSEGLVTFKLLKNSKYKYVVFTQNNNEAFSYGSKEEKLVSENIDTVFAQSDNFDEWITEGIEYFEKNKDKFDFIMSRSMAPESHIIALEIKKRHPNVKWIASFGDPIADNPFTYFYQVKSPYRPLGSGIEDICIRSLISPKRIFKNTLWKIKNLNIDDLEKKNIDLQNKVLAHSDRVILNNKYQESHMLKNQPDEIKNKVIIIPHAYDSDFYEHNINKNNDKIIFSYLGHLDNIRTPINFLKAIKRLKQKDKNLSNKLEINFYGNISVNDKLYIIDNELYDIVKVKKAVTYFESLKIMQKSDWLLLIDANLGNFLNENIFFAAKISDYLGSKSNIFGITMDNGPSADILRKTNSVLSSYSVDEIYMKLSMILNKKNSNFTINQEEYDIKNVVHSYDDMVNNL